MSAVRTERCITGEECGPYKTMDVRVTSLEKWKDVHEANNRADIQGVHAKLDRILLAGLTAAVSGIIALVIALAK